MFGSSQAPIATRSGWAKLVAQNFAARRTTLTALGNEVMKITTGERELLESTCFLSTGLGETTITFGDQEEPLCFILNFVEDEGGKPETKWEPVDKKTLRVTLNNWNNPLGTTLVEPIEIGSYKKRRLFVLFFVCKAGAEGQIREVTLSLYLGERV